MSNQPKQKIICLGLGRTGTTSLRDALEILGFGPCYHMVDIVQGGRIDDFKVWQGIDSGLTTSDEIKELLDPFGSILDYPPAIYGEAIYDAYPDAKYILTTRDPKKWEESMKNTIISIRDTLRQSPHKPPILQALWDWHSTGFDNYHGDRLRTNAQQELLDHNERIKQIIPAEKLLIYEVSDGWDKLVEFLGVPKPTVTFPHVNDTAQFTETRKKMIAAMEEASMKSATIQS